MEMLELFPTVVATTQRNDLSDHSAVSSALATEWHNDPKLAANTQTGNGIHRLPHLQSITTFVTDSVIDYIKQHQFAFDPMDLYIASSWANISTGDSKTHDTHYHFNSFISAVYYLQAPAGSGSIYFPHPNAQAYLLQPNVGIHNKYNAMKFGIKPEQGKCIVFRSSTPHGVLQNNLAPTATRISIGYTFNIKRIGENSHSSNYEEL